MFGKNWNILEREARSDQFFRKITFTGFFIGMKYHPIVLNESRVAENLMKSGAVVYAPNHIRTVDPLIIEYIIRTNVHWVALKRFFLGEDSIFNNSKNKILCTITKTIFSKLEFFPVERKQDNERPNNIQAMKDMCFFLRNGFRIGIFPEGTTRKTNNEFFGNFDPFFVKLAKQNNAVIQPVLIYWTKGKKPCPIVNFGPMIQTDSMKVEEIYELYLEIQRSALRECLARLEKEKK